jgi:hypothetical protein
MSRLPSIFVMGALTGALGACGADQPGRDSPVPMPASPSATPAPIAAKGRLGRPATVPAAANVFGAGRTRSPAPAGGGAGVLPTVWRLPAGAHRIVRIPEATGRVNPIEGSAADNGPGGDRTGPTDVTSYGGISGIVHRRNGMFLTGVFLADGPPRRPAPARLNFTRREPSRSLAPRLAQTFLVGSGKGLALRVPAGATRLFLGFADGYLYIGPPGWYGNNDGELSVTVDLASG